MKPPDPSKNNWPQIDANARSANAARFRVLEGTNIQADTPKGWVLAMKDGEELPDSLVVYRLALVAVSMGRQYQWADLMISCEDGARYNMIPSSFACLAEFLFTEIAER